MDKRGKIVTNVMLLMTALFWSSAFSVRKMGLEYMGPFLFNGLRFSAAFLFVLIVLIIQQKWIEKRNPLVESNKVIKHDLKNPIR